jgi:hypothetical protein
MPELLLHNRPLASIFNLLGQKENDVTYSIGWALSKSPHFLRNFLHTAMQTRESCDATRLVIALQEYQKDSGITDVEIRDGRFHVIIEAKRGWNLPSEEQLRKYLPRFRETKADKPIIVTASECSRTYAGAYLANDLNGIPIRHISWAEISALSRFPQGTHAEKHLMQEFRTYIATIVNMQPQESNWVYVVSLNYTEWAKGLTFVDVVEKRRRYFHPYGSGGWPAEPPNYLGFRYGGCLKCICHVEHAEVILNFHPYFPERRNKEETPHLLYRLGPPIRPANVVKTGKVFRSGRKWAMLDLLLTSKTIAEASANSYKRVQNL